MDLLEQEQILIDVAKSLSTDKILRDKQQEAFDAMSKANGVVHSYFKLPTGFGKTVMFVLMAREYTDRLTTKEKANNKVVILVPRQNLVDQTIDCLQDFIGLSAGTFYAQSKEVDFDIIVSTYQSMENLFERVGAENIGLIIADEAHHMLGDKRLKFLTNVKDNIPIIGFTATPDFSAEHSVSQILGTEIYSMTIKEGVESEALCPVKNVLYRTSVVFDATNVRSSKNGDFDFEDFPAEKFRSKNVSADVKFGVLVDEIAKIYANEGDGDKRFCDMRAMINCPDVKTAKAQAKRINEIMGRDVAIAIHSGQSDFKKRKADFESGKYSVVCQVNTLTEGFDDTTVSLCINYPSRSAVRIEQASGRVLRLDKTNKNKFAYVLDTIFRNTPDESIDDAIKNAIRSGQVLFGQIAKGMILVPHKSENMIGQTGDRSGDNGGRSKPSEIYDVITDSSVLMNIGSIIVAEQQRSGLEVLSDDYVSANQLLAKYVSVVKATKETTEKLNNELRDLQYDARFVGAIKFGRKAAAEVWAIHKSKIDLFFEVVGYKRRQDELGDDYISTNQLREMYISGKYITSQQVGATLQDLQYDDRFAGAIKFGRKGVAETWAISKDKIDLFFQVTDYKRRCDDLGKDYITASMLARSYLSGMISRVDEVSAKLQELQFDDRFVGSIKYGRRSTQEGWAIHQDKIDLFISVAGYKRQLAELGDDYISASQIKKYYISGKSIDTEQIIKKLQHLQSDERFAGAIKFGRKSGSDVWAIHKDCLVLFFQETGFKQRNTELDVLDDDYITASELVSYISGATRTKADVNRVSSELENLQFDERFVGAIKFGQRRPSETWAIRQDKMDLFFEVMGYKRKPAELESDYITASELCKSYIFNMRRQTQENTDMVGQILQNLQSDERFVGAIKYGRRGVRAGWALHKDWLPLFYEVTGFEPRKRKHQKFESGKKSAEFLEHVDLVKDDIASHQTTPEIEK